MEAESDMDQDPSQYFEIGATVVSGLEQWAKDECEEKLNCKANVDRGRIYFHIARDQLHTVTTLQAVNNLFVVVNKDKETELELYGEKDKTLDDLKEKMSNQDWSHPLLAWKQFTNSSHYLERPQDVNDTTHQANNLPIFRVTCTRSGKYKKQHEFSSQEAACATGGRINDIFGWPVKMKDYDIEVLVDINHNCVVIGIALTSQSLHRRNITHFGPTTLQSTIAYCMLRMSTPQDGDVICDPMCGGSSIPIEGARTWGLCHFLAGDVVEIATEKSEGNISYIEEKRKQNNKGSLKLDVFQWDVTNLPLRSNSVDVMITDMPFGKRMGSRLNNWELYKRGLTEMARVCRAGTGRAVLLTHDKKCMAKVLQMTSHLWRKKYLQFINMGGLTTGIYQLARIGRAAQAAAEVRK